MSADFHRPCCTGLVEEVSELSVSLSAWHIRFLGVLCRPKLLNEHLSHVVAMDISAQKQRRITLIKLADDGCKLLSQDAILRDELVKPLHKGLHGSRAVLVQ